MIFKTPVSVKRFVKKLKPSNNRTRDDHTKPSRDTSPERQLQTKVVKDEIDPSTNALEPAGHIRLEVSAQSEKLKPSLWDRAYDGLKKTDGQLLIKVAIYKEIAKTTDLHDNTQDDIIITKNQINGTDPKIRLEQLNSITSSGLQQLEVGKAHYYIFGHKFIPRNQLAQATQFIKSIRNVIDEAVKVSPYASLAWAGVCVILPIFMNPSIAEEASRDGCFYVTSRMQFYVKLESLLLSSDRLQASGLIAELEDRLMELYRQIIDFQMKIVRRVYLSRLARFQEDTTRHEDWEGMVAKIRESEKMLSNDAKQVNDASMGRELEKLSSNAERFFTDIMSVLVPLLTDRRREPTFTFRNDGSGSQYNATGGTQNNTTGTGTHFTGVAFYAPVSFG
ncbi:hypothetical protein THARTR1_01339 [Trichoderma harzianum]|uniref:NWD NACHT-NTPase N-terminal domain-containing protein n=1 Tax=Trichoderma harzianum TaxID=5544 RepID=A0A2K0UMU0_TRIHA|nr:hypothetical protein THARTR1_01339 [Trichoderma harzianum]